MLVTLASLSSVAQSDSEQSAEQWYQIELLVFTYQNPGNALQEIWPQQSGLHYPQRIVTLTRAVASEIMLNNPSAASSEPVINSLDYEGDPVSLNSDPEPESTSSSAQQNVVDTQQIAATDTLTPEAAQTQQPADLPAPLLVQLGQQPFTLLEPEQLQLSNAAKRLSRQTDIRPLFHGAWRQPIAERDQAESILIQGGDQYDNHFELEGSVSIGLERYLHIKTDLWLSSFVSNTGQQQNLWPVLPPRPITSSQGGRQQAADPFLGASSRSLSATNNRFDNPFPELTDNLYRVDRTVALQQDRRMRSDELHYIDHPLIGLLVKITAYEFPIIETAEPEPTDSTTETIDVDDAGTPQAADTTIKPNSR
jgi:hypothetical protein